MSACESQQTVRRFLVIRSGGSPEVSLVPATAALARMLEILNENVSTVAQPSRSTTASFSPTGREIQHVDELVGVAAKHAEIVTHVRDVAVRTLLPRL